MRTGFVAVRRLGDAPNGLKSMATQIPSAPLSSGAIDTPEELHRINRVLRTLRAGHRALLRAEDEPALLDQMCRVIVEEGGYIMAWIGYAENDAARSIRPVAHAGQEAGMLSAARLSWADNEAGRGASGTAIRTGKPSIGRKLRSDPGLAPWRDEAVKRGFGAVSGFPLSSNGAVIGCLVIFAADEDAFTSNEVGLLSELADDLAYGIDHLRVRARQLEAERTIERMAYYDALTDLPNRTLLGKRIGEAIARAHTEHRPLAVLAILLDHFNELSDTLGHRSGDHFLRDIVRRIAAVGLRQDEVLARIGEDEFGLLLHAGAERATDVARRIVAASYEPLELDGFLLDARAAIGIALFPGHADEPDELMRRAEVAMYRAGHSIDGFTVYSSLLDRERSRRLTLMSDLRAAIDRNDLLLYCQPKVHMASRRLCGAEALVRWRHGEQGMISPGEFVTLAEQTGLITPLTSWVLEAAFSERYAWHELGFEQPLAVNLSVRDLRDPKLLDRVRGLFETWGMLPDWMQFEVTESALMDDPDGVIETLRKLKGLGVKLSIDDFGTGYSSLSYLQRMPVDSVKIDQSFVRRMTSDQDSATIVRSTIELTHSLDLQAIAEGVESEELWQRLAALGCDACQGYYVGEPLPASGLPEWAKNSRWQ